MKKIFFLIIAISFLNISAQTHQSLLVLKNSSLQNSVYYKSKTFNKNYLLENNINKHSIVNASAQAVVGSATAVAFVLPIMYLSFISTSHHQPNITGQLAMALLSVSSYTFGAALGVNWIARYENPNNSLLKTFGFSAMGSGVGVILASTLAAKYNTIPSAGIIAIGLCPIVASMIYTLLIQKWPVEVTSSNNTIITPNKIYSQKDYIESTMELKLNIFQFNL